MIKQDWQKFKLIFFEECCKLACEAKSENKPKYFTEKKFKNKKVENLITYDYVEKMKEKSYDKSIAISCGSDEKRGTDSNDIINPDITFSTFNNKLKTFFECKILGANSKYIDDGIHRFIIEKYGFVNMPFYGMLGYVRDSDSAVLRYKDNLEKSINDQKNDLNLTSQEIIENSDLQVVFKTKHTITDQKCNPKIEITHILHSWESPLATTV